MSDLIIMIFIQVNFPVLCYRFSSTTVGKKGGKSELLGGRTIKLSSSQGSSFLFVHYLTESTGSQLLSSCCCCRGAPFYVGGGHLSTLVLPQCTSPIPRWYSRSCGVGVVQRERGVCWCCCGGHLILRDIRVE